MPNKNNEKDNEMKSKSMWSVVLLTINGSFLSSPLYAAPLQILDFEPKPWSAAERQQLCRENQVFCPENSEIKRIDVKDQVWVLSGVNIAKMHRNRHGLKQLNFWQFDLKQSDDDSALKTFIYPKLFPMDQQRYAIALIQQSHEYYSGGGAHIQRADFYELKKNNQTSRFIQDYPFYSDRMIRACFSYEDYQKAQDQCHDLYQLQLDIQVKQAMKWQLRYRYTQEISPVSDSGLTKTKQFKTFRIDLLRPPLHLHLPDTWNYQAQE